MTLTATNIVPIAGKSPRERDVRLAALEILTLVMRSDASLDRLLAREMGEDWREEEKRLLHRICYDVLQWQAKLDWALNGFSHGEFLKAIPQVKNALRIALYQLSTPPRVSQEDAISFAAEYIQGAKDDEAGNAAVKILSHLAASLERIRYPSSREDPLRHLSVMGSHPWWIAKRWNERFGSDTALALSIADNTRRLPMLRINTTRASVDAFFERLSTRGVKVSRARVHPDTLVVDIVPLFGKSSAYRSGLFAQCDETDMLTAAFVDAQRNEQMLVVGAGNSARALHIAMSARTSAITLCENLSVRAAELRGHIERLGLTNCTVIDSLESCCTGSQFDRVVVDVPCTHLGDGGRNPVIKWKLVPDNLAHFHAMQLDLLQAASPFVRSGGTLIYSVSSIEPEEGTDIIHAFTSAHHEFGLHRNAGTISREYRAADGSLLVLPHIHYMEGMYSAALVRA
jgi:16S rRNA (cytosine967-C5)-methyltransferase